MLAEIFINLSFVCIREEADMPAGIEWLHRVRVEQY